MTEPQVWVLIGVFAAGLFGTLTLVSTLFVRVIRAEIGGLDAKIDGKIGGLNGKIDGLDAKIDALGRRVDNLDRDLQALVKHTFGLDRG